MLSLEWLFMRICWVLWCLSVPLLAGAAEYQPLPPAAPASITADWLIHDATPNRLVIYLPGYHTPAHAYYQWVQFHRGQAFPLSFAAQPGFSLFLDNQLLFTATTAASYSLNLAQLLPPGLRQGRHLLGVWQPEGSPALASFASVPAAVTMVRQSTVATGLARLRPQEPPGQSVFLVLLLMLGLAYGSVRVSYPTGLGRIFQFKAFSGNQQHSFMLKPAFSLLNLLLVLLFALAFALLLTAIHTDLQNLTLLRQFINVPQRAIFVRVILYTLLVFIFIIIKYPYLGFLSYIFDTQRLIDVQYREFLRTTLLAGVFLPPTLIIHISLNVYFTHIVNLVANSVVVVLLVATVLRVGYTLHRQASLLNLHLFAYLCATEILPLLVLLKLLVFVY